MRNYLLAAVAVAAVASSPAVARDGSVYVGVEGGVLFPKDNDADVFVDYTTTQISAEQFLSLPDIAGEGSTSCQAAWCGKGLD